MNHTVKGFSVVSEAEVDVLEFSCFFNGPADVGNLISGSSAFSKSNLNIWKFSVHILLKPCLENFEHYFTTHSSILAWKIPWMEEPGRLQSMGSQRVGHNWATSLSLTSVWDECNCAVVWAFFGIALLWDWNENWPFPVLWPLLSFPNLLAYWVQHFHSIIFQDLE